jgi:hypothetical protein
MTKGEIVATFIGLLSAVISGLGLAVLYNIGDSIREVSRRVTSIEEALFERALTRTAH